jgi:ABC-type phosphate transport system ATPase subunit
VKSVSPTGLIQHRRAIRLAQASGRRYTIVIVTHNMQQATRVSDRTAFFSVLTDSESDTRTGVLVECGRTCVRCC